MEISRILWKMLQSVSGEKKKKKGSEYFIWKVSAEVPAPVGSLLSFSGEKGRWQLLSEKKKKKKQTSQAITCSYSGHELWGTFNKSGD